MKGQAAVEWIIILSVAILILAVMLSVNEDNYRFFSNNVKDGQVRATLSDLKSAADFVYSQGQDAKTTVHINIPPGANISVSTLPQGGGQIEALLYLNGKGNPYDVYTDANLTGSVPDGSGSYCMEVKYSGSAVNVSRSQGSC